MALSAFNPAGNEIALLWAGPEEGDGSFETGSRSDPRTTSAATGIAKRGCEGPFMVTVLQEIGGVDHDDGQFATNEGPARDYVAKSVERARRGSVFHPARGNRDQDCAC